MKNAILSKFKTLYFIPVVLWSCSGSGEKKETDQQGDAVETVQQPVIDSNFVYQTEQFADLRILRYNVPGFEQLTPKQRVLLYYLYEAALSGRDIMYDQNGKYNLAVRKTIENIVSSYKGDKNTEDWKKFMEYAKRVWFSNGIHHHYSSDKIMPDFSAEYFAELVNNSDAAGFPMEQGEDATQFTARLSDIMLNPKVAPKKVSQDPKKDLVTNSAGNFYEGVTQKEVEDFYSKMNDKSDTTPVMYGLNSKLVKENGQIVEKTWKVGGMYSAAIEKIVYWLEKAVTVAENDKQKKALELLIKFYKTGNLKDFDDYSIAWVNDTESAIDVVNGFIEVYNDPLGYKGSFEAVVNVRDPEASKRIATIGSNAKWFETNSPIMEEHKKKNVTGITAKVINVVIEGGDAAPSTPIGINLPNSRWIRKDHGSKSVNLGNIVDAYDKAAGKGVVDEFYINDEIRNRIKKCGSLADKLHTDMHEVIGHASGQLNKGVGQPSETLKNYGNALEEGRADLVALYYLMDPKLVELGVMPSLDYGKAHYDAYITKGIMTQLTRIKLGNDIEEAHMRNRQMVAMWAYEKGKKDNVIEKKTENGKTYFVVNDYEKLRVLFGELLREVQRVISEGDYKAGKDLIENYGRKIDPKLHKEVLDRYASLNIAPYAGFIQPVLKPVMKGDKVVDAQIEYPQDFTEQMMYYAKNYSFLPVKN